MAKEKFERTKPHVNIGTIGHAGSRRLRKEHGNWCCSDGRCYHRSCCY